MAATIQITPSSRGRRRIPSDPLDESIYNMVLRPGIEDRPPPLYKSKFASHVRAEHLAARRTMSNPGMGVAGGRSATVAGLVRASGVKKGGVSVGMGVKSESARVASGSSSVDKDGLGRSVGSANANANGSISKVSMSKFPKQFSRMKRDPSTKIHAPKKVSKPISKPTSGRIAMAAERRSNASTPVVADPLAWDHLAADAAESTRPKVCEVPEELIEQWEPFAPDVDDGHMRRSSPPPTEMSTGAVSRKTGVKKGSLAAHSGKIFNAHPTNAVGSGAGGIGGGSKRRMLPEAERLAVLAGLKSNYQSLQSIYNRLPMATDTVSKINRKTSIEKQLVLLEDDIKKFSHPNIIIDEGN
ncbi:calmodulin-binding-domain-containing protein [Chytriomyces sp. MP71]|nr:calmodulin-binding-domain-containing protein [Chytriomyces sp. MP71]